MFYACTRFRPGQAKRIKRLTTRLPLLEFKCNCSSVCEINKTSMYYHTEIKREIQHCLKCLCTRDCKRSITNSKAVHLVGRTLECYVLYSSVWHYQYIHVHSRLDNRQLYSYKITHRKTMIEKSTCVKWIEAGTDDPLPRIHTTGKILKRQLRVTGTPSRISRVERCNAVYYDTCLKRINVWAKRLFYSFV